jgi:hypothetical protein
LIRFPRDFTLFLPSLFFPFFSLLLLFPNTHSCKATYLLISQIFLALSFYSCHWFLILDSTSSTIFLAYKISQSLIPSKNIFNVIFFSSLMTYCIYKICIVFITNYIWFQLCKLN